jgi:transcriptional regulator with XRE-family HTH domain
MNETKHSFSDSEHPEMELSIDEPVFTASKRTDGADETVKRVLSSYDIGQKLRQLRLRKKIALTDLGKHTGLSASMLSQLENGKLIPTLPTLARIAMVFDVGLEHFFSDKRTRRVFSIVRAEDRIRFPELADSPVPGYFFEVLAFGTPNKQMSAYLADFPPSRGEDRREHFHDGSEFIHVLEGILAITYQGEEHILGVGDSVYFDASEPHCYRGGDAEKETRALVVTVPPRL